MNVYARTKEQQSEIAALKKTHIRDGYLYVEESMSGVWKMMN